MAAAELPAPPARPHGSLAILRASLVWRFIGPRAICLAAMGIVTGGEGTWRP